MPPSSTAKRSGEIAPKHREPAPDERHPASKLAQLTAVGAWARATGGITHASATAVAKKPPATANAAAGPPAKQQASERRAADRGDVPCGRVPGQRARVGVARPQVRKQRLAGGVLERTGRAEHDEDAEHRRHAGAAQQHQGEEHARAGEQHRVTHHENARTVPAVGRVPGEHRRKDRR